MSKKRIKTSREKFVNQKQGGNNNALLFIGGLIVVAVIALIFVLQSGGNNQASSSGYDTNIEMTDIKSTVENGKIAIDLSEVKKNKLVYFTYDKNQVETGLGKQGLPLTAFYTPKGKLFAGVSMCEPCKGTKFRYETDNTITCTVCGTKWDIETLEGVSGACLQYPPDEVKYNVKDGKLLIDESEVATWKPRV